MPVEIVSQEGSHFAGWSFETDPTGALLMARDQDGRHRWKVSVPGDSAFNDIVGRNLNGVSRMHIRDGWLALSVGTHFVVIDAIGVANPPRVVWQQTLRTNGTTPAEAMFANQAVVRVLPNGRVVRLGAQIPRTLGQFVGLTRETAIYTVGSRLIAAELETGRLAWSRQDVVSRQCDASADDRVVSVRLNGSNELIVLRTLDGRDVAKRRWSADDTSVWERGSLHLVSQSKADGRRFEMRDVEKDAVLWSHNCPAGTELTVIEDEDAAIVEPDGKLTTLRLMDGREQYHAELPLKLKAPGSNWIAVQRLEDRDLILGGGAAKVQNRSQIVPFDASNATGFFAFDGHVCAVSRADGKLLWATPVERMIFDRTQPSRLPILLLAARQFDQNRVANNPFVQNFRMNASIIDKQTGRVVYSTEENALSMSPRLEPDPDNHTIIANFHEWQLEFKFPEPKPEKP